MRPEILRFIESSASMASRGLRLLVEFNYAGETFEPVLGSGTHMVSVFGSARIHPGDPRYAATLSLGRKLYRAGYGVVTGGSNGLMEAANRGAAAAIAEHAVALGHAHDETEALTTAFYKDQLAAYSVGLQIKLPHEQSTNPYLGRVVMFRYFAIRKFYFAMLASGFICCDGGWGTRDELWEMLTLVQTGRMPLLPIIILLSGDAPGQREEHERLVDGGFIHPDDLKLIRYAHSDDEAVAELDRFYRHVRSIEYIDQDDGPDNVVIHLKGELPAARKAAISAWMRQNAVICRRVAFVDTSLLLEGFQAPSYGLLRDFVDLVNGEV